ncbi:thiamine pyrophosphate-binding protein [Candidatus Fukatsuia endosymbiont of Tuberolachnus salignus]|uniref:thiamine pyrophosphate-binding protein n=1 Tax=Candidatus Fukatsuia endosymbiont of Tuberolachnus salignus TaxID=3077957 RepID=UPI00313B267E
MINADCFLRVLAQHNVNFYSGVPNPLLSEFCFAVYNYSSEIIHQIACNDKAAIGMAIGSYLATGDIPAVYLKNSGLSNIINPVCSHATPEVYGIPLLIIMAWQSGSNDVEKNDTTDASQDKELTLESLSLLKKLHIPYQILDEYGDDCEKKVASLLSIAHNECRPVALLIKKNIFSVNHNKQQHITSASVIN